MVPYGCYIAQQSLPWAQFGRGKMEKFLKWKYNIFNEHAKDCKTGESFL